jgi:hydrogenase nickel incorporation protein HypA/HybF
MHEGSLIVSLLRQVEDLARLHGAPSVSEVCLEIGPLAGVEPLLMRAAFDRLRVGTLAESAELAIDLVGLTCRCRSCQLTYASDQLRFVCPACGDQRIDVVAGDSVTLHSCTFLLPAEATAPP